MAYTSRIARAFEQAKIDFEKELDDQHLLSKIKQTTSMKEVYDAAQKIQEDQAKTGRLRHLRQIEPYLKRLQEFEAVINTFVQVKPEILGLVWGPIKFLLILTNTALQPFDAIRQIMCDIGNRLPFFEAYATLFEHNDRILDVLVLFYRDILDFHATALRFFRSKRWQHLFASVWPRHKAKIDLIGSHIEQHSLLLSNEVQLEHIRESNQARVDSLKEWSRARESQEWQEFHLLEVAISAHRHENELYRLQKAVTRGTGEWILKKQAFTQWLDITEKSKRLLWLQGIPGAGKTHLSSVIVNTIMDLPLTCLFAYISYKRPESISSISLLHSLIVQLASNDRDLQTVLCKSFRSNKSNLLGNPQYAREVLAELLQCAGPTFLLVDGLDETDDLERRVILDELTELLKSCPETKLCISSRPEHDISKAIKEIAEVIRVDHDNSGSIQVYVTNRMQQWFRENPNLEEHDRDEIKGLLAPLSSKAKGMFLFARIVLDNFMDSLTMEEIRQELQVLPESLEEAYSRILKRLKYQTHSLLSRARRLLGYLGCSPVPLTVAEAEQLLSIVTTDASFPHRIMGTLDVVKLCGPIVEVIDEYVYFVHFTVRTYLFEHPSEFVDKKQATFDLTSSCLNYLSMDIFKPDIDDEAITENILSGKYCLYSYATSQWLGLVCKAGAALQRDERMCQIINRIEHFFSQRSSPDCEQIPNDQISRALEINTFKTQQSSVYDDLARAIHFRKCDIGEWRIDEDLSWADTDPLTLSTFSKRLFDLMESIICPETAHASSCRCARLRKFYGRRLFKCKYTICHLQRVFFETKKVRDDHARQHGRPFKCPDSTCTFAKIGFFSHAQFQQHWSQCHMNSTPKLVTFNDTIGKDEIQPLLFDLVKLGRVDEVRQLRAEYAQLASYIARHLTVLSARLGLQEMFEILALRFEYDDSVLTDSMKAAIEAANLDIVRLLLHPRNLFGPQHKSNNIMYKSRRGVLEVPEKALTASSPDIFDLWFENIPENASDTLNYYNLLRDAKDPSHQLRLLKIFKREDANWINTKRGKHTFRYVADKCCSSILAQYFLESGINPDCLISYQRTERTPLHIAATKVSAAAAQFIKLLLLWGACPEYPAMKVGTEEYAICLPADERGAKKISKWLGMTWAELTAWSEQNMEPDKKKILEKNRRLAQERKRDIENQLIVLAKKREESHKKEKEELPKMEMEELLKMEREEFLKMEREEFRTKTNEEWLKEKREEFEGMLGE